jgi:Mor family transcriptional regulator
VEEVLRRYSNRPDLLGPMIDVLRRIEENDQANEPGVHSTAGGGARVRVRERLTEAEFGEMLASFRAGTPKHELAKRYGISLSSVKRVLRTT